MAAIIAKRAVGRQKELGEKQGRDEEAEGAHRGAPVDSRDGELGGGELGRVEGAHDGALAHDPLALGDGPDDRLYLGLCRGELALALRLVEEGVFHGEAHNHARRERGKRPGKTAIGYLGVHRVAQGLQRD
jgi:hypothetical protein